MENVCVQFGYRKSIAVPKIQGIEIQKIEQLNIVMICNESEQVGRTVWGSIKKSAPYLTPERFQLNLRSHANRSKFFMAVNDAAYA
jgi:hypothetical protein